MRARTTRDDCDVEERRVYPLGEPASQNLLGEARARIHKVLIFEYRTIDS